MVYWGIAVSEDPTNLFAYEQYEAATKIARDLDRYERKRRIAARIIGAQKKELCELSSDNIHLLNSESHFINLSIEQKKEKDELKAQISELQEQVYNQKIAIDEYNNANHRLGGKSEAYETVIDKMFKYQ